MMIEVTKVGDLTFEIRFDESVREDLTLIAGWGTEEWAIGCILSDILLGNGIEDDDDFVERHYPEMLNYDPESDGDLDGEIPF
ncbi:hypothetical protein ACGGKE_03790 [Sphingobium naphthae]|uniref:hypothetical protein n=1 Tax=Sphingobium naphthae TaxID=1886786 RepID=UPI0037498165